MIKVGVIGYGYWGPNLVRNFVQAPGSQVVAVSDLREDRLAEIHAGYPTIKTTTDSREVFADPTIDAIAIATPVSTHFDLAMQALRAGKHILVEKPMTANLEQGERLVEEAARRKKVLMVDHVFVYTGAVRKIRELVEAGRLGQIYYYDSVRVNLGLFQHDVNVLWDLAAHDLSIMDYVLDERPCAVSAMGSAHVPGQPKNLAYLTCLFHGNLIAHFHVNWLAPVKVRRTLVGGERQMIVYDDLEVSEKVKVYDKGVTINDGPEERYQMLVGYRTGDMWAPQLDTTEGLAVVTRHFLECIEQDRQPLTDGKVGLRVVQLLEAATASLSNRGRLVELETSGVTSWSR
ncbi:MAG: Gfo/Idh/MocA family protein [Nitrospiraceae bacterium]